MGGEEGLEGRVCAGLGEMTTALRQRAGGRPRRSDHTGGTVDGEMVVGKEAVIQETEGTENAGFPEDQGVGRGR